MSNAMNAPTISMNWFIDHRRTANRVLYVMVVVALVATVALPTWGAERATAAFVWLGIVVLLVAPPWTEILSIRTSPMKRGRSATRQRATSSTPLSSERGDIPVAPVPRLPGS